MGSIPPLPSENAPSGRLSAWRVLICIEYYYLPGPLFQPQREEILIAKQNWCSDSAETNKRVKISKKLPMPLNIGWTNHLLSTRSHIRQTIAKMERIAVAGQSPSGSAGTPLTPLPAEEWQQIRRGPRRAPCPGGRAR